MSASDKKDELTQVLAEVEQLENTRIAERSEWAHTQALCLLIRTVIIIWGRVEK